MTCYENEHSFIPSSMKGMFGPVEIIICQNCGEIRKRKATKQQQPPPQPYIQQPQQPPPRYAQQPQQWQPPRQQRYAPPQYEDPRSQDPEAYPEPMDPDLFAGPVETPPSPPRPPHPPQRGPQAARSRPAVR